MAQISLNQKGVIHLFIPLLFLTIIAGSLTVASKIPVTNKFDSNIQGVLVAKNDGDSSGSSNSNSSSGSGSSGSGSSDKDGLGQSTQGNQGKSDEAGIKQEIRTEDLRIKTDTRNDRERIDIYQGDTKTRIQQKDGKIMIKTEVDEENEASGSSDDGTIEKLRSISKFPLRIDTSTNQLIMTKNGVERILTVLPAHAVQNMLRAHLKKGLGPKFFTDATPSAEPSSSPSATPSASESPSASPSGEPEGTESSDLTILEEEISLEEKDGQTVYKIPAKKHLRLFGFIPITTDLTGFISAETGFLVEERQSLLARILDFLSP